MLSVDSIKKIGGKNSIPCQVYGKNIRWKNNCPVRNKENNFFLDKSAISTWYPKIELCDKP